MDDGKWCTNAEWVSDIIEHREDDYNNPVYFKFDLILKSTGMRSVMGMRGEGSGRLEVVNLLDSILKGSSRFSESELGLKKKAASQRKDR